MLQTGPGETPNVIHVTNKNDADSENTNSLVSDQFIYVENDEESQSEDESQSEFDEKQYLAEFMTQTTSANNSHSCNLCHKEFKHVKWLQSHMKSHSNWIKANCKKLPECEICGKAFKGPGMLKMHMKVHSPKTNTCSICQKSFQTKSVLYRHRQTHFPKTHVCQICSKPFATNYQLNNHLIRHRGEKSFKCLYCEKAYYGAADLKVRVHSLNFILIYLI